MNYYYRFVKQCAIKHCLDKSTFFYCFGCGNGVTLYLCPSRVMPVAKEVACRVVVHKQMFWTLGFVFFPIELRSVSFMHLCIIVCPVVGGLSFSYD